MTVELSTAEPNTLFEPHQDRGGVAIHLTNSETSISPLWSLGGFEIQFLGLLKGASLALDVTRCYLKVVTGEIDCHPYKAFPASGEVISTRCDESSICALQDSVLCIVRETDAVVEKIASMAQLKVLGPLQEQFAWQTFDEKFAVVTDIFHGLEAHMVPGFHLLDVDGAEIAYVHFWTTGKGVDVSTHNHGQAPSSLAPAFAEVHLVLRNGTGAGAMYQCDAPGATERERTPIQAGEEHGPFFAVDSATGLPKRRENGAVDYPWHGWQGGADDEPTESYDLVAAFEINPEYVKVS